MKTRIEYFGIEKNVTIIGKTVAYLKNRPWTEGPVEGSNPEIVHKIIDNSMGLSMYNREGNNIGFIRYAHLK